MTSRPTRKTRIWWTDPPPDAVRAGPSVAPSPRRARLVLFALTGATMACVAGAFAALELAPVPGAERLTLQAQSGQAADVESAAADEQPGNDAENIETASVSSDEADVVDDGAREPLAADNPRWAAVDGEGDMQSHDGLRAVSEAMNSDDEDRQRLAESRRAASPPENASAYAPSSSGETGAGADPAAGSDDEVAALQDAAQADEEESARSSGDDEAAGNAQQAPAISEAALRPAVATSAVNLRARPGEDGTILAVLPRSASIQADGECRNWCGVVYDGQRGFVYRDYIRFDGEATATQEQQGEEPQAQDSENVEQAASTGQDEPQPDAAAAEEAPETTTSDAMQRLNSSR